MLIVVRSALVTGVKKRIIPHIRVVPSSEPVMIWAQSKGRKLKSKATNYEQTRGKITMKKKWQQRMCFSSRGFKTLAQIFLASEDRCHQHFWLKTCPVFDMCRVKLLRLFSQIIIRVYVQVSCQVFMLKIDYQCKVLTFLRKTTYAQKISSCFKFYCIYISP